MIQTHQKQTKWDALSQVIVLFPYKSKEELTRYIQLTKRYFSDCKNIHFIIMVMEKELPEQLPVSDEIMYFTKKDFSIFGQFKQQPKLASLKVDERTVLLFGSSESNKNVKKILDLLNVNLKIGWQAETLPNFDLSFMMERFQFDSLLEKTVKYLKKI